MHAYGESFMELAMQARYSADVIARKLLLHLPIVSVLDLGSARGTWLARWLSLGVEDFAGVDGPYVSFDTLEIPPEYFFVRDLSQPIELGRRFSLSQSLEVAEHLPAAAAATFVKSLTRHADIVLFSASPPGQGGENHLNEQPYEYWRELFAEQEYEMIDWIRPRIADDHHIKYWYRYNAFLFISKGILGNLAESFQEARVPDGKSAPDVSPSLYRMRRQVVRRLPRPVQSAISRTLARSRGIFGV